MNAAKLVRCAIYTRVSTDQGLDQEFNSLDAQREASEAYIKSQSHEGWTCLKQAYDDGGYSGGSIERPSLQALLNDVKARKLDVIVVYKVDRLTRSLADFAKLVELFDAHNVSFVSVTQSFNTTSSMGRLTLNVLLSFAQFEREVTGERIRDKVSASRKKGMWMGGVVPLGYRVEYKKLLIEPSEAEKIRQIFALYLELKSLPKLAAKLNERGILSRQRNYSDGRTIGGQAFRTGALSHLLANRVYLGEVRHHKLHYSGEHEAILEQALFDLVQAELAARLNRSRLTTGKSKAELKGLLFDSNGNRMTPTHANKAGVRYRYYQSWVLAQGQKDKAGVVNRVPAPEIEQVVFAALQEKFARQIPIKTGDDCNMALFEYVERIDVLSGILKVHLKASQSETSVIIDGIEAISAISIPWTKPSMNRRRHIIGQTGRTDARRPMRSKTRTKLLKGIAQGRIWMDSLINNQSENITAIATRQGVSEKTVRSTLSFALLAPDIVSAAINGQLPRNMTTTQMLDLPADWQEQRKLLCLL